MRNNISGCLGIVHRICMHVYPPGLSRRELFDTGPSSNPYWMLRPATTNYSMPHPAAATEMDGDHATCRRRHPGLASNTCNIASFQRQHTIPSHTQTPVRQTRAGAGAASDLREEATKSHNPSAALSPLPTLDACTDAEGEVAQVMAGTPMSAASTVVVVPAYGHVSSATSTSA